MVRESASSKILRRSLVDSFIMDNLRDRASFTLPLEIIILANLSLIRRKAEASITGLERKVMFMKESLRQESVMEKAPFGGVMAAGMKGSLGMECKVDGEFSIERAVINNTRGIGTTVCSMAKVSNSSRTASATRALSNKINFTVTVFSSRMTR